jgi:hypothetical protein
MEFCHQVLWKAHISESISIKPPSIIPKNNKEGTLKETYMEAPLVVSSPRSCEPLEKFLCFAAAHPVQVNQ